ncbi:unnamed protein product [Owenia fusiformis]|uniref:Uncharacterized protein n=1 Tax=Owenia fusiformis TaxID=6347 RepID=A0A8S4PZN6_OWEFU|nr:unnamed protein product [Owenia fusiformis]
MNKYKQKAKGYTDQTRGYNDPERPHNSGSGQMVRTQDYARDVASRTTELHNRSLRNLSNSKSLFEQQLEQQQRQFSQNQQQSLHDFSAAIMSEINGSEIISQGQRSEGPNMEGAVIVDGEDESPEREDSPCSMDSLEVEPEKEPPDSVQQNMTGPQNRGFQNGLNNSFTISSGPSKQSTQSTTPTVYSNNLQYTQTSNSSAGQTVQNDPSLTGSPLVVDSRTKGRSQGKIRQADVKMRETSSDSNLYSGTLQNDNTNNYGVNRASSHQNIKSRDNLVPGSEPYPEGSKNQMGFAGGTKPVIVNPAHTNTNAYYVTPTGREPGGEVHGARQEGDGAADPQGGQTWGWVDPDSKQPLRATEIPPHQPKPPPHKPSQGGGSYRPGRGGSLSLRRTGVKTDVIQKELSKKSAEPTTAKLSYQSAQHKAWVIPPPTETSTVDSKYSNPSSHNNHDDYSNNTTKSAIDTNVTNKNDSVTNAKAVKTTPKKSNEPKPKLENIKEFYKDQLANDSDQESVGSTSAQSTPVKGILKPQGSRRPPPAPRSQFGIRDSIDLYKDHKQKDNAKTRRGIRWADEICDEEESDEDDEETSSLIQQNTHRPHTDSQNMASKSVTQKPRPCSAKVSSATPKADPRAPRAFSAGTIRHKPSGIPTPTSKVAFAGAPAPKASVVNVQEKSYAAAVKGDSEPKSAVYGTNGIRLDRTPTDDEINWLWDKVRTCLNRDKEDSEQASSDQSGPVNNKTPIATKVMDGANIPSSAMRTVQRIGNKELNNNVAVPPRRRTTSEPRHSLLQHRRLQQGQQPATLTSRDPGRNQGQGQYTVTQYTSYRPMGSQNSVTHPNSATNGANNTEVTESLAGFLAAEAMTAQNVSESQINHAVDLAQSKQLLLNSTHPKEKVPTAISIEEQRLMQSLERLNERLKITEQKAFPESRNDTHIYTGGFRGQTPIRNHQRAGSVGINRGPYNNFR